MSSPLPPSIVLPSGDTAWLNPYSNTYSPSRDYALRMQRNFARGSTQSEARGHTAVAPGVPESVTRRQRFLGRYGISQSQWERWRRLYIREINLRAMPGRQPQRPLTDDNGQRKDPRIYFQDILAIKQRFDQGYRDPADPDLNWVLWIETRLGSRLNAIVQYQDFSNALPGRQDYYARNSAWPQGGTWMGVFNIASAPPIEMWYYH
jgi:hypothetical protein